MSVELNGNRSSSRALVAASRRHRRDLAAGRPRRGCRSRPREAEAVTAGSSRKATSQGLRGRRREPKERARPDRRSGRCYGRLDVMFNNAGISKTINFLDTTEEDFERIMRVNGLGVMIGIQEAARQMISQGQGGKIVNTASIAASRLPALRRLLRQQVRRCGAHQAAGRALASTRSRELLRPRRGQTELWKQLDTEFMELGLTKEAGQAINEFSASILIGRAALPADIVGTTSFLASKASDYITGQTIMIDAAWS